MRTLEADLIRDEGLAYVPYKDTRGNWTIGVGHYIGKALGTWAGKTLSPTQVAVLLRADIRRSNKALYEALPWAATLDPVRRKVLENMAFNMGAAKLLAFHDTLAAAKRGDYRAASKGMLSSLWATQVGARAQRLATMMETGEDA